MGRDSSVGIATRYGLDDPGIEFRLGRGRFSSPSQPPSNGYLGIPGDKAAEPWR